MRVPPKVPLLRRVARRLGYWELRRGWHAGSDALQRHVGRALWPKLAPVYRPLLADTTFIAITGSVGKTTTKELLAGILGRAGGVAKTAQGGNQPVDIANAILRTRRRHRYAVHEVGVGKRGGDVIDRSMALIRPSISVVTSIGDDHISAYRTREAIAREKGKIVDALPPHGTAVLNADDALVRGMAARCRGKVVTYGRSADADVRADRIEARWPDRLAFDVSYAGTTLRATTQLCGEHWIGAALAAVATAIAAGVPIAAVVEALADVPPTPQRMYPVLRDDGVAFVHDDAKSPLWTMPAALSFLANARAGRRILVMGTLSDYAEHRPAYVGVARAALDVADHAIFFGEHAWNVQRTRSDGADARLQAFTSFVAAKQCLDAMLRPGDLVLLKGNEDDRMGRFVERSLPSRDGAMAVRALPEAAPPESFACEVVVVGLGNPDARLAGSRHNVGRDVVERLAQRHAAEWQDVDGASIALIVDGGLRIALARPAAQMNHCGPALQRAAVALGLAPERTILVHDEAKLALGRIRGRLEGGDGGHLGTRSVLQAFDDHRFRRVKVGIGMPPAGRSFADHVLGRFDEPERAALAPGLDAACAQVLKFAREIAKGERATG